MRGYIGQWKQQEAFETMMRAINGIAIYCGSVCEAHYGNKDVPLEKEGGNKPDEEPPETITTEQRKAEQFQSAATSVAKGKKVAVRKKLCWSMPPTHVMVFFV